MNQIQLEKNAQKAAAAIRKAYKSGKINRAQANFLLSGVKI